MTFDEKNDRINVTMCKTNEKERKSHGESDYRVVSDLEWIKRHLFIEWSIAIALNKKGFSWLNMNLEFE